MHSRYGLLMLLLVALIGCATFATSPPAPPLALPIPGAATEYTWSRFKWKPGNVLTYTLHTFIDSSPRTSREAWCRQLRKAVPTKRERNADSWCRDLESDQTGFTMQMRAMEYTLAGAVRVQVVFEGIVFGYLLMGKGGEILDLTAEKPEFADVMKGFVEGIDNPCLKELLSKTAFKVGEKFAVLCPRNVNGTIEFVGYAHLDGKVAAAFRSEAHYSDFVGDAIAKMSGSRDFLTPGTISMREDRYVSPEGILLATYGVTTQNGKHDGEPYILREIRAVTLDRQRSSGF